MSSTVLGIRRAATIRFFCRFSGDPPAEFLVSWHCGPRRWSKITTITKKRKKCKKKPTICWWIGWMADTFEAHLRPAGTHIRTAKMCHSMQAAEKMGPISSSQIPLRRSYTFKEHLRLYFNPCSLTVCAFGAKNGWNMNSSVSILRVVLNSNHTIHRRNKLPDPKKNRIILMIQKYRRETAGFPRDELMK